MRNANLRLSATVVLVLMMGLGGVARAARLKDVASIRGIRSNQLVGYGLVVGLNGTGDDQQVYFTLRSVQLLLRRLGVQAAQEKVFDLRNLRMRNAAAVMVTASLPPFGKIGSKLDVTVSSLGNAATLQGGTLLLTPLRGVDLKVYALAQGPLMVGGYTVRGRSGSRVTKNHPTVARIPSGAIIEREVASRFVTKDQQVVVALQSPDATTVARLSLAINRKFKGAARSQDPATIAVTVPGSFSGREVEFVAALEAISVTPDAPAHVVINERTGTVIVGEAVHLSPVAISHGSLTLEVSERFRVSQPQAPFSSAGKTVVVPDSDVRATEGKSGLQLLKGGANLKDVVKALNALGASPRDLISIFQSLVDAGALPAKLVVQ
jgi:flagellar P-ring protein precursor FlgI